MIKGARYGVIGVQVYLFTHYNPNTHEVYTDDLEKGWIDYDKVCWNFKIMFKGGKAYVRS